MIRIPDHFSISLAIVEKGILGDLLLFTTIALTVTSQFLSASLYFSKRGAY